MSSYCALSPVESFQDVRSCGCSSDGQIIAVQWLARQNIRIGVFGSRPVLDLIVKVFQDFEATCLLTDWLWNFLKPLQGSKVRPDGKRPSQEILPELFRQSDELKVLSALHYSFFMEDVQLTDVTDRELFSILYLRKYTANTGVGRVTVLDVAIVFCRQSDHACLQ